MTCMKKLALPLLLVVLLLPGAAEQQAARRSTARRASSSLGHGTLLAVRESADKPLRVIDLRTGKTKWWLPAGIVTGATLVHRDGSLVTWLSTSTGRRLGSAVLAAARSVHARRHVAGREPRGARAHAAPLHDVRDRLAHDATRS